MPSRLHCRLVVAVLWFVGTASLPAQGAQTPTVPLPAKVRKFVSSYCLDCHSGDKPGGKLDLKKAVFGAMESHRRTWEMVVRKLRARQMPPLDATRPRGDEYSAAVQTLTRKLDHVARLKSRVGRTQSLRRLTRIEYQNAIRDLLELSFDVKEILPKDDASHGFDNVIVGELSPTLLNRYVTAAQRISRLAIGRAGRPTGYKTIRVRPDITQEKHLPHLPLGTRGGTLIPVHFPRSGEYEIGVRLARDRNEEVEGLRGRHQLEILLDRKHIQSFVIQRPARNSRDFSQVDAHLKARLKVPAGPHRLAVTFAQRTASLLETKRQPYQSHFNMHRHPRLTPAVYQVTIAGPFRETKAGDTPSRNRVFISRPSSPDDEDDCARKILTALASRAWRKPASQIRLDGLMRFFHEGHKEGGFEAGIESALAAILVNPQFLFRVERNPPKSVSGRPYPVSDLELASRLSFFLWSSIPDPELIRLAARGELHQPAKLDRQVRRMLADHRSRSLVTNFAGQWLHLRNLDSAHPDMRRFPDFDHNLRRAMRTETELFFESVVREDRSVLNLLRADYTFLNERLARHYGIPHIHGSRFRRVVVNKNSRRGGLLRHASILTVTSYATRTSPVLRGKWILDNLLGTPPPPPPDNVAALKDNSVSARLPIRQRLAQHRADARCAACHDLMDPVGFSLENYDAIGRWRFLDAGQPVDARGGLPDGSRFEGVAGLEKGLLKRPELFVGTLTEKLLTFALGRGIDHDDAAAVRRIIRDAKNNNYRFSDVVAGIVKSPLFLMRTAQ